MPQSACVLLDVIRQYERSHESWRMAPKEYFGRLKPVFIGLYHSHLPVRELLEEVIEGSREGLENIESEHRESLFISGQHFAKNIIWKAFNLYEAMNDAQEKVDRHADKALELRALIEHGLGDDDHKRKRARNLVGEIIGVDLYRARMIVAGLTAGCSLPTPYSQQASELIKPYSYG